MTDVTAATQWRQALGPTVRVKDPEAKKHPCIVTYDQLPAKQRAKDFLFTAVVHSLKGQIDDLSYYQWMVGAGKDLDPPI